MTDYTKTTDFGVKDGLSTGNANKLVRGSEFDTEFDAIQTAVGTKADKASPTFTGTVTGANLTINGTFKLADTSDDHYYTWAVNELTADRTVTMPLLTGNDTFVFEAHTATLTNKTFDLGTNTLTGSAAEFDASLQSDTFVFTSEVGSVVQAYDADLTTIAGLSSADGNFIVGSATGWVVESGATVRTSLGLGSLATASTINNSNWSGTDLAVTNGGTGASTAVAAAHALIDGISLTAATVAGTDKVLIQDTDGSDVLKTVTAQSIADLSGGSYVLLSQATAANSATIDFTSATSGILDGTYEEYVIRFSNLIPSTDGYGLVLRTSTDGGSTWDSTAGDYITAVRIQASTTETLLYGASATYIYVVHDSMGSAANETGASGEIRIFSPDQAAYCSIHIMAGYVDDAGLGCITQAFGRRLAAADVTGVRLMMTGDNIESGEVAIYGVKYT